MSALELFEKFLALGQSLGKSGDSLSSWVEDRVSQELKREEKREKEERQEKEKERQEKEKERQEKEKERQEKEKDRQLEYERLKLSAVSDQKVIGAVCTPQATQRPKLPPLLDASQVDLYLERFERYATSVGWKQEEWASCLANLLQDEALSVFLSLSSAESADYESVKRVLLRRFGCDKNGFKSKFFSVKPQSDEDFGTYINRARRYFDRWLALASVSSFDDLTFLICSEVALQACDEEFVAYIKDRTPSDMSVLKAVANSYLDSRPNRSFVKKQNLSFTAKATPDPFRPSVRSHFRGSNPTNYSGAGRGSYSFRGNLSGRGMSKPSASSRSYSSGRFRSTSAGGGRDRRAPPTSTSGQGPRFNVANVTCHQCGGRGHIRSECPSRVKQANETYTTPSASSHCCEAQNDYVRAGHLRIESCKIFDRVSTLLRDSGCNTVGVNKLLVPPDCYTGREIVVNTFCCKNKIFPTCIINVQTPYFSGDVEACLLDDPVADLIVGNIKGAKPLFPLSTVQSPLSVNDTPFACVVTRAQALKEESGTPAIPIQGGGPDILQSFSDFPLRQREDPSLTPWFSKVGLPSVAGVSFVIENGVLKRVYAKSECAPILSTLVVPESLRHLVLSYAHESHLSGHAGFRKTLALVRSQFSWPGLPADVRNYTTSCHICQLKPRTGRDTPAPLQPVKIVGEPFERVIIDIVGPLPLSTDRCQYLLTLIDTATRWAEAVPLKAITTKDVAEALFSIFTRLGFPKEIQSDRGPQFMSQMLSEFNQLCNIEHFISTPYHPQTNGLVERFHSTLKSMIKKLSADVPSNWTQYVPAVLFAYRNHVHSSTGYSPFFLLFGRSPRGPMQILAELWEQKSFSSDTAFKYQFVLDLHNRIKHGWKIAKESIQESTSKTRIRHESSSKLKQFEPGDEVLVLLPTSENKLRLSFRGPFKVIEKRSRAVYNIDLGERTCIFHVNLLRKYHRRKPFSSDLDDEELHGTDGVIADSNQLKSSEQSFVADSGLPFASVASVQSYFENDKNGESSQAVTDAAVKFYESIDFDTPSAYLSAVVEEEGSEIGSQIPTTPAASELSQVSVSTELSSSQRQEVTDLLYEFRDILTSVPGRTSTLVHEIRLTTDVPIRVKPYPLPYAAQDFVKQEVRELLSLGVIEPSNSPYSFPIVVVKKKNGSMRLCIDFRKLNAVTIFDAENIPLQEDLFSQLSHASIFSSCDLCKAYWQVPLHPDSRKYTAFQTPLGLMHWVRMPFGLVTAPATFCRLMRTLIGQTPDLLSFFDDTLVFSTSWQSHMTALRSLLTLLRYHGLHVNPSKLSIGNSSAEFLGHVISAGTLNPVQGKIDEILKLAVPTRKKEVRSLLGLVNYYRHFLANFAELAAPLSDLLRKGAPEKVQWTSRCDVSFNEIKRLFSTSPILIIPDLTQEFVVRSDASDFGVGAVLLQDRDGVLMPCRYASRKLLPRETRYSAIEREALGLVFAVTQFQKYLAFKHFLLQTDHKPLAFLRTGSPKNARLMRWALALQEFSFEVSHIPGSENVHADVLSRLC